MRCFYVFKWIRFKVLMTKSNNIETKLIMNKNNWFEFGVQSWVTFYRKSYLSSGGNGSYGNESNLKLIFTPCVIFVQKKRIIADGHNLHALMDSLVAITFDAFSVKKKRRISLSPYELYSSNIRQRVVCWCVCVPCHFMNEISLISEM